MLTVLEEQELLALTILKDANCTSDCISCPLFCRDYLTSKEAICIGTLAGNILYKNSLNVEVVNNGKQTTNKTRTSERSADRS